MRQKMPEPDATFNENHLPYPGPSPNLRLFVAEKLCRFLEPFFLTQHMRTHTLTHTHTHTHTPTHTYTTHSCTCVHIQDGWLVKAAVCGCEGFAHFNPLQSILSQNGVPSYELKAVTIKHPLVNIIICAHCKPLYR